MRAFFLTVSISLFLGSTTFAAGLTENIQNIIAMVQSEKRTYIEDKMHLSPEEKEKFLTVYDEYQNALREINEDFILFVWSRMEDTGYLTSDKAQTTIKEYLDIERERLSLKETFIEKFTQVLPPGKLIRYYQLENRAETFINARLEQKIPLLE
jgi:hypothetical protein